MDHEAPDIVPATINIEDIVYPASPERAIFPEEPSSRDLEDHPSSSRKFIAREGYKAITNALSGNIHDPGFNNIPEEELAKFTNKLIVMQTEMMAMIRKGRESDN